MAENKQKRKIKIKSFWGFLGIYSALLVVLIAIGLIWVYGLLGDYEQGMPDGAMAKVLEKFSDKNIDKFVEEHVQGVSEFETSENVLSKVKGNLSKGELSFVRKNGEFTSDRPVYVVKSGDTAVAKVSLKESGKNRHGFTLWEEEQISFGDFLGKDNAVSILAPANAEVLVNNKKLSSANVSESGIVEEKAKNVGDFVSVPTNNMYKIEGLLAEPEITATLDGVKLDVTMNEKTKQYVVSYPKDDDLLAKNESRIKNINQEYGKYIINRGSLSKLQSYMVGKAKEYISDIPAIWAYLWGKTFNYDFPTNEVSNCVKYSDDCFSCDVHFNIHVNWGTGETNYDTNMTYVFVRKNNDWYLADFAIN